MSLAQHPEIALFLALAIGHLIGAIRVGPIQLGGVCGTLIVALILGQSGVRLDDGIKSVFFALFIFALGYTGGPQFFSQIAKGWRFGVLSLIEVLVVLLVVITATWALSLSAGAAAGLLAGAATESAVIGTASEALTHLPLGATQMQALQGEIATAYSITYLFGLITIVLFTSQIAPMLLGVNLRQSAAQLAQRLGEEPTGSVQALPDLVGRAYLAGHAAGLTVAQFEASHDHAVTIVHVRRAERDLPAEPSLRLMADDVLLLVGRRATIIEVAGGLGSEVSQAGLDLPVLTRDYILGQSQAVGRTLEQIRTLAPLDLRRGVYITGIQRLGHAVDLLPGTVLQRGDVVRLFGTERAVELAGAALGQPLATSKQTDFIMLGAGVFAGLLIGMAGVTLGGVRLTLGLGGGCLVSGLVLGWYASRHAGVGAFPAPAAQILKDFGLAAFIAAVGFSAGPDAVRLMATYGFWLPVAGVLAALLPALVSLFVGHKILKLETPFLLGAIAGQQCSTPAISALTNAAGNSTPVVGYTVTYAISNVLLPLLGPVVVSLAYHMT